MWLSTHTALLSLINFIIFLQHGVFGLQDVTADLFGAGNVGTVAAFGDFNSDKQTDVFVIREGEYRLSVLMLTLTSVTVYGQLFTSIFTK